MIRLDPSVKLPLLIAIILAIAFVVGHAWENREQAPREYSNECSICHHGGHGQARAVAPIFGRVGQIAQTPEGHQYLLHVLLNGLDGPIRAEGNAYDSSMPSFQRLPDAEIARILTFVARQNTTSTPLPLFTPQDVADARKTPLSPHDVLLERQTLDRKAPLP